MVRRGKPASWLHALIYAVTLTAIACFGLMFARITAASDETKPAWGNVKGRVIWGGEKLPKREAEVIDKDKEHCSEKGPIYSEKWVVNKENKGMRWAFVWLGPDPPDAKKKLPVHPSLEEIKEKELVMDQPFCAFVPHALGMREGQNLVVKNSSPVPHDVRWAGSPLINPGNDVLVPAKGSHTIKDLRKDRMPLLVSCSIHFWMKAYVRVFDHPYFAVTDADGAFEIKQAPSGNLRLVVWHEGVGWRGGAEGKNGAKITIKPDETVDLGKLVLKEE